MGSGLYPISWWGWRACGQDNWDLGELKQGARLFSPNYLVLRLAGEECRTSPKTASPPPFAGETNNFSLCLGDIRPKPDLRVDDTYKQPGQRSTHQQIVTLLSTIRSYPRDHVIWKHMKNSKSTWRGRTKRGDTVDDSREATAAPLLRFFDFFSLKSKAAGHVGTMLKTLSWVWGCTSCGRYWTTFESDISSHVGAMLNKFGNNPADHRRLG